MADIYTFEKCLLIAVSCMIIALLILGVIVKCADALQIIPESDLENKSLDFCKMLFVNDTDVISCIEYHVSWFDDLKHECNHTVVINNSYVAMTNTTVRERVCRVWLLKR